MYGGIEMSTLSRLAEALRLIRVFHDLKQYELSDRLGISQSYLSEIESGRKEPSIGLIKKYSQEFKIPLSSILFFSERLYNRQKMDQESEEMRKVISQKIVNFLQFVEEKTDQDG